MNSLCADIGYRSVNHFGEELCGDHVDVIEESNATVIVLADGLGSGVKANILSTLTSKIISTMVSAGLSIEDCVETMAATLPVCSARGVAYSTFTLIRIIENERAELIQYDNPHVILLRNGESYDYRKLEMNVNGKKIYKSTIHLQEDDVFVAMSDGCPHAGVGKAYDFGWKREDIIRFMEPVSLAGYTAKTLSTILMEEVCKLYESKPGDDATVCTIRICKRKPMNLLIGPASNRDDDDRMMSLFFSKEGKHIVCGGTTSMIAARYLNEKINPSLEYIDKEVPPTAQINGVDLVTEGVLTINKALSYARDYLADNGAYQSWGFKKDGASLICRYLFEDATDINFFVGRAVNPAHQNPDLPITFNIKMNLVNELSAALKKMGKRIKVSYF